MRKVAAFVGFVFMVAACDNSTASPAAIDPLVPASITLRAAATGDLTSAGDTRILTAVVKNGRGDVIEHPVVEWSSSAGGVVASVVSIGVASGIVTAINDGTATITARSGAIESAVQIVVHRTLASVSLTTPTKVLEYGTNTQFVATAFDAGHNAIPNVQGFTFTSDNPSAAFVQPNGVVTALFKFPQLPDAAITASLTRDGITATAKVNVIVSLPDFVDYGALMLTENVVPLNPPTRGSGLALFTRAPDRVSYRVLWSDLRSPVTHVQLRGPAAWNENGELLVELGPRPTLDSLGVISGVITRADIQPQQGRPPISLDSLASLLCSGQSYVDVRTNRDPNGVIRGQLNCIDSTGELVSLRRRSAGAPKF